MNRRRPLRPLLRRVRHCQPCRWEYKQQLVSIRTGELQRKLAELLPPPVAEATSRRRGGPWEAITDWVSRPFAHDAALNASQLAAGGRGLGAVAAAKLATLCIGGVALVGGLEEARGQQSAIKQGLDNAAQKLSQEGKKTSLLSGRSQRSMSEAQQKVADAMQATGEQRSGQQAASALGEAADALNRAAFACGLLTVETLKAALTNARVVPEAFGAEHHS